MEQNQVRRIPMVNEQVCCYGMVAQANIARSSSEQAASDVVTQISQPTGTASRVAGA